MKSNINIIHTKENILELDIKIEGIKSKDQKCFFVIKTKDLDFSFKCKNISGNKWEVTIPRMPQIETTLYNYYIYMVIDGYYIEPYNGTINVTKSTEVEVKDINNTTFKSDVKTSKTSDVKKPVKTSESTKAVDNIIVNKSKDKKLRDILSESKYTNKIKISPKSKIRLGDITEF